MELSTSSISNEIDKSIREEFSVSQAAIDDIRRRREKGQKPEAISNEEIRKGDPILNTYKVLDDAIHGGMGSVWRVHHESWNVDLAMKRPQPRFFAEAGDGRKEEFIRECENWINLGLHPNIVSCYYVREIGGVPTIFSEWMDNGSLKDCIKDGSLYEGTEEEVQERILDIAIQTARGLKYSHENGLIHQDVKPGNILLTKGWDAKVADFGLAKAQSQLTDGTKPASSGYTIQYCPKEQAEGAPAEKWMDVYAWALTVLEMYVGKRLWETGAEAFSYLFKEMTAEPERNYRVDAPEELLEAWYQDFDSGSNKWRGFKYYEQLLEMIYRGITGREYPDSEPDAVTATADNLNNKALSYVDLGMPQIAETCWSEALQIAPDHVSSLYNQGLYQWRTSQIDDVALIKRLKDSRLLGQIHAECGKSPEMEIPVSRIEMEKKTADVQVDVSSDGKWIYVLCDDLFNPELKRINVDTLQIDYSKRIFVTVGQHKVFTVSNGGDAIFVSSYNDLHVIDSKTGDIRHKLFGHSGEIKTVCLHPDGVHCYSGSSDGSIRKWNIQSGVCERTLAQIDLSDNRIQTLTLSPDGKRLYGTASPGGPHGYDRENKLFVIDESTMTVELVKDHDEHDFHSDAHRISKMLFSSDGKMINSANLSIWDPKDMKEIEPGKTYGCQWIDPDGNWLLTIDTSHNNDLKVTSASGLRCLCTAPGFQRSSVDFAVNVSASFDLSVIAAGSMGLVSVWKDIPDKLSKRVDAPWELSRIKAFRQVYEEQKEAEREISEIKEDIVGDRIENALARYTGIENKYDFQKLWPSYQQLAGFCKQGKGYFSYEFYKLPIHTECIAFDPFGKRVAVATDHSIVIYDYMMEEQSRFDVSEDILDLCFSETGKYLAAAFFKHIQIWDINQRKVVKKIQTRRWSHSIGKVSILFSPDETQILLHSFDERTVLEVWNIQRGERIYRVDTGYELKGYCYSKDGKSIFACGYDMYRELNGAVFVLDLISGEIKKAYSDEKLHGSIHYLDVGYNCMTLSPKGDQLILMGYLDTYVFDTNSWDLLDRIGKGGKPAGSLAVFSNPDGFELWKMYDLPECLHNIIFTEPYQIIFLSPDGMILAVCCEKETHLLALKRELVFPGWKDWDSSTDPYLENFIHVFPKPDEEQKQLFISILQNEGFGYIREEAATAELKRRSESFCADLQKKLLQLREELDRAEQTTEEKSRCCKKATDDWLESQKRNSALIEEKRQRMEKLGILRGKEKKQLAEEISQLENKLTELSKDLERAKREYKSAQNTLQKAQTAYNSFAEQYPIDNHH